ncbi:MAG: hypothetical protein WC299_16710, partial [Kiritimatiellia bacterium]
MFAFFACVASLPASSEPFIVKDGRPQADIVISDKPTRAVKLAANELALHIFKMSGAQLPVVTGPGKDFKTHIYVGRSPWADKLGINFADLTNDMFKVVSGEGYLALVGHDTDFQPTEPWCKSAGDRPRMQADWEKRTGRTWLTMNLSGFKNYNNDLDIWMNDGAGSLYAVYDFLRA